VSRPVSRRLAAIAAVALAAAAACSGPGAGARSGHLTMLVAWGGNQLKSFSEAVVVPYERRTGVQVDLEPTRALTQHIDADLRQGDPPDVAALPSIGAISQYAQASRLYPLDGVAGAGGFRQPWSSLMRSAGRVYAVPVKVDVKSLVWYDPATFRAARYAIPATWPQLLALSSAMQRSGRQPWCLAVASGATSGWPGADWLSDIMLSSYPAAVYQDWAAGKLPWTSGPVRQSWLAWNKALDDGRAVFGGHAAALTAKVGTIGPASSGCLLSRGTLVDQDFAVGTRYGTDYAFFPFPPGRPGSASPLQVGADFVGMFRDSPAARDFIGYLTQPATQRAWIDYPGSSGFSPSSAVPPGAYPDPARRDIAKLLTSGRRLCLSASDVMPSDVSTALDNAVLAYLTVPGALTSKILPTLATVPAEHAPIPAICG
jgi:alpha-glucoside transport system substrate-binding protein